MGFLCSQCGGMVQRHGSVLRRKKTGLDRHLDFTQGWTLQTQYIMIRPDWGGRKWIFVHWPIFR